MHNRTVLQVIPALETGGAEQTAVDVAAAIVDAGGTAIVASAGGRLESTVAESGARHETLPLDSKNPAVMALNVERLGRLVQRYGVDLVHARSRAPAWSALAAARRAGLPFVTTYHGAYAQTNPVKAFYNSVMARGDVVIANSHFTARLIAERHAGAEDRITVVHRGSDLDGFDPAHIDGNRLANLRSRWGLVDGPPVVLNLARLTGWKGQTVLINALKQLEQDGVSEWQAVLAGDDQGRTAYTKSLHARIEDLGLSDRVRIVGHCDDVAAAMTLSDVVAVASTEPEAFGRAAVEAQASGTPVVVTDIGAVRETVLAPPECSETERTGWRVPPNDSRALADGLAAGLSLAGPERDALGARGRAHARAHFSLHAMTDKTLDIYRSLLS
ncbi:MAG: glycosyltransferase family 4 protein [Pseudomonadota bacterium]